MLVTSILCFSHNVYILLKTSPIILPRAPKAQSVEQGYGQCSFRRLLIVIATGFIPLSPLSIISTMVMWESSQWLGKNIVPSTGKKNCRKAWVGTLASEIWLKTCWKRRYTTYDQSILPGPRIWLILTDFCRLHITKTKAITRLSTWIVHQSN